MEQITQISINVHLGDGKEVNYWENTIEKAMFHAMTIAIGLKQHSREFEIEIEDNSTIINTEIERKADLICEFHSDDLTGTYATLLSFDEETHNRLHSNDFMKDFV